MSNEYYNDPTITNHEDIGDKDCSDWIVTASFRGQTAQASSRDRFKAEAEALVAVVAKVKAKIACPTSTPDTDHDFVEVE
jgi:hypothetical protein